jgi:tetratricopeptide (TPR) repeat protein
MSSSVGIDNTTGDVSGVGISGSGNIIGKDTKVEVNGDYIVINNPSKEAIVALKNFLKVPTEISQKNDLKDTEKIQQSKAAEPVADYLVNLMDKVETDAGTKPAGIKVGELNVSSNDVMIRKYMLEGNKFFFKGDYDNAISRYEDVISIDPYYAEAWYNEGNAYEELKRYDQAIRCYDKATQIDPSYSNAWYSKGDLINRKMSKQKFVISLAASLTFLFLFTAFIPLAVAPVNYLGENVLDVTIYESLLMYLPIVLFSLPAIILFFFFWQREGNVYFKKIQRMRRRLVIKVSAVAIIILWGISVLEFDQNIFNYSNFYATLAPVIISAIVTVNFALFLWNSRGKGDEFLDKATQLGHI